MQSAIKRFFCTIKAKKKEITILGEVREWLNRAVSKTVVPFGYHGFESHPLRNAPKFVH